MKALIRNEEAQAGVGTLIIFIAMVLVAAVAAAVLIQTSGTMQSKSTSTTKEASAAISENLVIESVDGIGNSSSLTGINITVRPAAGSPDIDLSKVTLKVKSQSYNYSRSTTSPGPAASTFKVYVLRDADGVLQGPLGNYTDGASPALRSGALARIDADVSGLGIQSKNSITIALTPEKGTTFTMQLSLPAINSGVNALYP